MAQISAGRIQHTISPAVTALGMDLEDLTVRRAGRRNVIVVVVDRDGGIDLDAVAEVSRAVSASLDATEVTGDDPYVLEVTSPGVDRPLTAPRHWRRAVGRLVAVQLADGSSVTGRIQASDDEQAELDCQGSSRTVRFAEVGKAVVQVEFGKRGEDD